METKRDILKGYKEWLRDQGVCSGSCYNSYLKGLPLSRICEMLSIVKESGKANEEENAKVAQVNKILKSFQTNDAERSGAFVNAVVDLVNGGELLYARTLADVMCYAVAKVKKIDPLVLTETEKKALRDGTSAWRKFREYLTMEFDYGYTLDIVSDERNESIKKRIAKGLLSKINSFDGLVSAFEKKKGGTSDFIRFTVEQSFFFSPEVMNKRMIAVVQSFSNGERLFARKTTDSSKKDGDYQKDQDAKRLIGCFVDKDLKIPVVIDTDGNKEVRRLINEYTGYTIGAGKNSIFHNFIISHLWGQAYDPRYFTNFWNIAIVPAWVNSLLDKETDDDDDNDDKSAKSGQGSLVKRLKDTFMNISKALYEQSDKTEGWEKLQMNEPTAKGTGEVVSGQQPYRIKILCKKEGNEALGAIEVRYYTNNGSKGKINSK